MSEIDSGSHASHHVMMRTLDATAENSMMSVYCTCGRIVVLDRAEMRIRLDLGKELECSICRNIRISNEIDALNAHYDGLDEIDEYTL